MRSIIRSVFSVAVNQGDDLCPEFSSDALPIVFRWTQGGRSVDIVGSFNNWSKKIPLNKSTDDFVGIIDLPEGICLKC